jgi:hypothetical protein
VVSTIDPETRAAMDAYLGRVQGVMIAAAETVPAHALNDAQRLVDHGEPAEGLLALAWAIRDSGALVPAWIVASIRDLTSELVDAEMLPSDLDEHAV